MESQPENMPAGVKTTQLERPLPWDAAISSHTARDFPAHDQQVAAQLSTVGKGPHSCQGKTLL